MHRHVSRDELSRLRASVALAREQLTISFRSNRNIEGSARQYTESLRDLRLALQSLALERG
jgi:hypothetical protein